MASNTNYSSITDLLTSFTPIERPTRVHYNPFPEIERMNNTYRWYNYPGDQPKEKEVSEEEEASTPEASTSSTPSDNTTEQTVEEDATEEKRNLNEIINSSNFKLFLSKNYNKYYEKLNNFKWDKNGTSKTYLNDINQWLSNFTLTDNHFPIVTTRDYWDVDKFNEPMDLNKFKQYFDSTNHSNITPLLRQTYITIWAVNDFLNSQSSTDTPPPTQQAAQSQNPTPGTTTGQDQDTDQVYREYFKTLGSLPYK